MSIYSCLTIYLIETPFKALENITDPDQAALGRDALFGSTLFAYGSTVKPAVAATSIKRDSPFSSHFRAPRMILNANAPLLSGHLSNATSGWRNSPQNTEIVSSNGLFLWVDAASFD